jgi:hypothetical protein
VAIDMQGDGDEAALRLYRERAFSGLPGGMQIAGEDAESIAGLFCLAPVGVVDAQTEVGLFGRDQCEDPVATEALVAIADAADFPGRELEGQLLGVHHYIVVAESMPAKKPVLHLRSSFRRSLCVVRET